MSALDRDEQQAIRELAYFLWESEGKPEGRELAHWGHAVALRADQKPQKDDALSDEAEAILDGDPHADFPALITKDVPGG